MTTSTTHLRAAACALLAALMFALMGAAVRYSSAELPTEMTVFLRNAFGLLALLPWLLRPGLQSLATRRLPAHLLRAAAGLTAMYCFFYALANLQLAEAIILNYSAPLFIALFALLLLGERASRGLVLAIFIGFAGVALIVKPGSGVISPAALAGLASGVFTALAMVGIRHLSSTEPTRRIVFYFSGIATLISAIPLLWAWQLPGPAVLLVMAAAGCGATLGQLLLTRSYSMVPAARVGPYSYASILFAALLGWLFWAETLDEISILGGVLIILAGVMTLRGDAPVRLGS